MFVPTRATVAALVLAGGIIPATSTAGLLPSRDSSRLSCEKTFTVPMFARAARATYRGTRLPPSGSYGRLWHYARCTRPPATERQALQIWRVEHAAWAQRRSVRVATVTAVPESALAACIISRESGGNPEAVNGQYEGIAQWSPTSWAGGGGTRYSSTPLGATYAEQVAVLNSMLPAQAGQWTPYDSC